MKPWLMLGLLGVLGGCAVHSGSFDFVLSDGRHVTSGVGTTGGVNNAGYLSVEDDTWGLVMDLQGLSPGSHDISSTAGDLQIWEKGTGDRYAASLGGACAVWLDPHGATNGSPVAGHFSCTSLTSATGTQLDVTNGDFEVPINDPANNPTQK
jgi:hypothetical protein